MDENKKHAMHDHSQHEKPQSQRDPDNHNLHTEMDDSIHGMSDHSAHDTHQGHNVPLSNGTSHEDHSAHAGHGTDHTGHEQLFRVRFWWCLLLSIPVLLYSGMIQTWLNFTDSEEDEPMGSGYGYRVLAPL